MAKWISSTPPFTHSTNRALKGGTAVMNKPCACCGATSNVQIVALCPTCQAAPRVAAVTRKLAGPVDWNQIVGAVLYDEHGHPVARVRSIDIRHDRLDVSTFGSGPSYVPGQHTIRIEADGIIDD